ncbi:AraC family transcriptional regulator [Chryseobacterium fluminis]|uniref:helix-turn-helix domain-containing protein n=1 Tax=Chryseobacterium fluminis TaxID=2983606 RepID=UPI00224FB606|nr:AraC family transcriptional regulator [Chryseobacterium sp. MMS21-Ot14]UZT98580.1 AraC family transcriptional regulator [Chryseobacterium sp. MMS21-Ot14]
MGQSYDARTGTRFVKTEKDLLIYARSKFSLYLYSMNDSHFGAVEETDAEFYIYHVLTGSVKTEIHHHSSAQLVYAEGGIVHIFTDSKHWYLPARCFMWIPAGTPHYIFSTSPKVDLYNFYFKKEEGENGFYDEINIYSVSHLLREMILYTKEWDGKITKNDAPQYYFLKALKGILPEKRDKQLAFPVQHPFPSDETLLKIAQYIHANLEKHLSIESTAKEFGMSTRTLSRKFKEILGMNYVRFLRALRITRSLELMIEGKYNMYEIAMMVGYNSLSSFSNIFKKVIGIPPTEYQQKLKGNA